MSLESEDALIAGGVSGFAFAIKRASHISDDYARLLAFVVGIAYGFYAGMSRNWGRPACIAKGILIGMASYTAASTADRMIPGGGGPALLAAPPPTAPPDFKP
jgi:hypothetical protein